MLLSLGTCCWSTNLDKTKKGNIGSRAEGNPCTFGIMSLGCNVSGNIVISHIYVCFSHS